MNVLNNANYVKKYGREDDFDFMLSYIVHC